MRCPGRRPRWSGRTWKEECSAALLDLVNTMDARTLGILEVINLFLICSLNSICLFSSHLGRKSSALLLLYWGECQSWLGVIHGAFHLLIVSSMPIEPYYSSLTLSRCLKNPWHVLDRDPCQAQVKFNRI